MSQVLAAQTDDGLPLHIEVGGAGPPLLLVGNDAPLAWWERLRPLLEADFTVIAFDYRAPEGWSRPPEPRDSTAMAVDALVVLDAVGRRDPVHLVGLSRGALVAFHTALADPGRVDRLVLLVPVAPWASLLDLEGATVADADPDDPWAGFLPLVFTPGFLAAHRDDALGLVAFDPNVVHRVERGDEPPVDEDVVVAAPTLVVLAELDGLVPHDHGRAYAQRLPHARIEVIAGQSHAVVHEDPAAVAAVITPFLRSSEAG